MTTDTEVPARMDLMKWQRAEIGVALSGRQLEPLDFDWSYVDSESLSGNVSVPSLTHVSSGYYFTFDQDVDGDGDTYWICRYAPGIERMSDTVVAHSWESARQAVSGWAAALKRELESEDPWEQSEDFHTWTSSEEQFTAQELVRLDDRLDEVQQYLIEKTVAAGQSAQAIRSGIDELKQSARTVSKKDWALLFAGWFFTHCADWALGQSHWQHVVHILLEGTKQFLLGA